ncbi:MAG: hypothetical protein JWO37_29 [Acidimicrobiales bacterium]|jgi:hypothetical protein|nr:hypothetical protein [Acidimicrobiales bacterium]
MPALSPDLVPVRNERLSWRVLEGEALILFPEAGTLHRLNETGTCVWQHVDGERSVESIVALLIDEYDVTTDEASISVAAFVADLTDAGLLATRQ